MGRPGNYASQRITIGLRNQRNMQEIRQIVCEKCMKVEIRTLVEVQSLDTLRS